MAVSQAFNAVVITKAHNEGEDACITYCNPAFCAMTGYSAAELMGQSPRILQGQLTDRKVIQHLRHCLETGTFFEGSTFNYRKDGSAYLVEWNISPVRDANGQIRHYVSVQQDITSRALAEQRQALLAQALHATHDAVLISNADASILFANQAFEALTGYSQANLQHPSPAGWHNDEDAHLSFHRQLYRMIHGGRNSRHTFASRHKEGWVLHLDHTLTALPAAPGEMQHYVSVIKDVTEFVEREQLLHDQAHRDPLTRLFNRRGGTEQLRQCQRSAQLSGQPYAVILGDIDDFKQINDRFGHGVGDIVLKHCATLLNQNVRINDAVIRWGGEEFLIVLPGCELTNAIELAESMCNIIATSQTPCIGNVSMSFGVGAWQAMEPPAELVQRTDLALYKAKKNGKNQVAAAS